MSYLCLLQWPSLCLLGPSCDQLLSVSYLPITYLWSWGMQHTLACGLARLLLSTERCRLYPIMWVLTCLWACNIATSMDLSKDDVC